MTFALASLALWAALSGAPDPVPVSSAAWLRILPDGTLKRQFILDCTGCHQFDTRVTMPDGVPRTRDQWIEAVRRMISYGGSTTGFPVIAAGRTPEATAEWLSSSLARGVAPPPPATGVTGRAEIREYPMPMAEDLPHDVALEADGSVVITGMFSHAMYRLDPASGGFTGIPLPVDKGGPRAVEVDREGNWWVLLGGARLLGRYTPESGQWRTWPLGMYPHSVALDSSGAVWFNGHFTRDPELVTRVDPSRPETRSFEVPRHPTMAGTPGGPIPYELRSGPDGRIWGSELQGNRIFALTPATGSVETWDMPRPLSGPRRLDVAPDGVVWIPGYADNSLVRFDPTTGRFTTFELPIPDALPYVVRVDPVRKVVWIGTGAADALIGFDLDTCGFSVYPLPSRGALVRHIAIDPRTHDVWLAYGASPGRIPARVARLRLPEH